MKKLIFYFLIIFLIIIQIANAETSLPKQPTKNELRVVDTNQLPPTKLVSAASTIPTFSRLGKNYLIIIADKFVGNTKLTDFVNWKKGQGYNVIIVSISQILSAYPVPPDTINWLKIRNLENAYFTPTYDWNPDERLIISYNDGVFGEYDAPGSVITGFYHINTPSQPEMVNFMWWSRFGGYSAHAETKSVTLVYDGGKSIIVSYPPVRPGFDHLADFYVGLDGKMHFKKSEKWSVWKYIKEYFSSKNGYVLLIGDKNSIPTFDFYDEWWQYSDGKITDAVLYKGVSDHSYSVLSIDWENFENNNYEDMVSDIGVGRLPVKDSTELGIVLDKIKNKPFFQDQRAIFMEGRESWSQFDTWYKWTRDSVMASITKIRPPDQYGFPRELLFELRYNLDGGEVTTVPTHDQMINVINSGSDFIFTYAHGWPDYVDLCWDPERKLTTDDVYKNIAFNQASVFWAVSCLTGNFLNDEYLAHAFLVDSNSNVKVYVGAGNAEWFIPSSYILTDAFTYLANGGTFGEALKNAKISDAWNEAWYGVYERLNWQIFSDPSLSFCNPDRTAAGLCYTPCGASPECDGVIPDAGCCYRCFYTDINGDTYVNAKDSVIFGKAFRSKPGDPNWNPAADINKDNHVNAMDAIAFGQKFGASC